MATYLYPISEDGSILFQQFVAAKTLGHQLCIKEWLGDDICDEKNNIEECDYDQNDCCKDDSNFELNCADCSCKDSGHVNFNWGK